MVVKGGGDRNMSATLSKHANNFQNCQILPLFCDIIN